MIKKIIPTEPQKKRIQRALKEYEAIKIAKEVLKNYKGKNEKLLKIKNLCR